jgi:hypothetical protein
MPLTKIQSLGITDGTIAAADIASGAITAAKLASGVGGKVLQVVTATDTTSRSTTSSSFVTGSNTLSVSITPSSASNKIFVAVSSPIEGGGGAWSFYYTIYRDSTDLGNSTNGMQRLYTSLYVPMAMSILDSPSTTSATTYQVYMRSNGGTANLNSGGAKGTITAFEISA